MVSIKHRTTGGTDMSTDRETLFDARAAHRAILRGELCRHSHDRDIMCCSIVIDPLQEFAPGRIANALREATIAHHITYLQVFVGNEIARCHKRVCLLPGKIFALPLDLQMCFC